MTQSSVITTIDSPEGLEAYVNVPLERSMDLRTGLTVELLDTAGQIIASNPITFIAPRADDTTQSVLVKATLRQMPANLRVMQYGDPRILWTVGNSGQGRACADVQVTQPRPRHL